MADFLSRLIERTMAREPAVAPVISPMYAQERSELRQEMPLQVVASEDDHPLIADIPPIGADLVVSQSVTPTLINPQRLQFPQQAPAKTDCVLSQEESLSRSSVNLPAQSIQRSEPLADKQSTSDQYHKSTLAPTVYELAISTQREPQPAKSSQATPLVQQQSVPSDKQTASDQHHKPTLASKQREPQPVKSAQTTTQREPQPVKSAQTTPLVQQQSVPPEAPLTTHFTPLLEDRVLREPGKPVVGKTLARISFVEGQERQAQKPSVSQLPSPEDAPSVAPTIQVTIGRIEVRATQPPASPHTQPGQRAMRPTMSLDQYLQQRGGEGR